MALDFNYTVVFKKRYRPEERNVYHALYRCSEAVKIKSKHKKFGVPPTSENRNPCEVCLQETGAWLRSLQTSDQPAWFR